MTDKEEPSIEEQARLAELHAIAEQNDQFRRYPDNNEARGRWVYTAAINAAGQAFLSACVEAVRAYDNFTEDNDPYGTHEMGFMKVQGKDVWWKIDLFDLDYAMGSPNPSALVETRRVLTILFPDDY